MDSILVYKFDGTVQCDADILGISLEAMRKTLSTLIGESNILSMRKGQRPVIQQCGVPTGKINCYEITETGWAILTTGIAGHGGFQRMDHGPAESDESVNLGRMVASLVANTPTAIADLVGHPLRTYKTGDMITKDWRPERFNIELDESRNIVKVWFG